MSGRAGRPQYDDTGYSYLIAKSMEEAITLEERYINGQVEPTNSKLIENKDAVFKQIIAQVASTLSKTPEELQDFFTKTFYGYQMTANSSMSFFAEESLKFEIMNALEFLLQNQPIR